MKFLTLKGFNSTVSLTMKITNVKLMKREAGGQGGFLLCPQGKAPSPRFMGVIVLGDVCLTCNSNSVLRMQIPVYETPGCPVG
jgi:hypothetical protein